MRKLRKGIQNFDMGDIILKTKTVNSIIHCGRGAFEKYAPALSEGQTFIVTDSNVAELYKDLIARTFCGAPVFVLPAGEKSKNFKNLIKILEEMMRAGMRRNCRVVAFGGGVVGDIGGLAASLYMRGVRLVQIPTTLLAQVDSSVGGKTAVDHMGVKNVIGAFYQPQEVICDPRFFATLPKREIRCGLGEVIKYGALDKDIYGLLIKNENKLSDGKFLEKIVEPCIRHKVKVVQADERDEGGARKSLNMGHTTGHALELFYGRKSHGEYVLIGMYYELKIALKRGICGGQYAENLEKLIKSTVKIPAFEDISAAAFNAVHDKKNVDENISVIVPRAEGEYAEIRLPVKEYAACLDGFSRELRNK